MKQEHQLIVAVIYEAATATTPAIPSPWLAAELSLTLAELEAELETMAAHGLVQLDPASTPPGRWAVRLTPAGQRAAGGAEPSAGGARGASGKRGATQPAHIAIVQAITATLLDLGQAADPRTSEALTQLTDRVTASPHLSEGAKGELLATLQALGEGALAQARGQAPPDALAPLLARLAAQSQGDEELATLWARWRPTLEAALRD